MTFSVAINGYGRIGRNILRALFDNDHYSNNINIIAINDLGDVNVNAHLTKYDTIHGVFNGEVTTNGKNLIVNGNRIMVLNECNPKKLPWNNLKIDLVFECTGIFASNDQAIDHINAGAKKVLISAPAGPKVDATIVYGINDNILNRNHKIVSNASCTTNCLAPLAMVLNSKIGIEHGLMTTIHSYTNDQALVDVYHKDLYRSRSASHSIIPTKTGAAKAIGLVLPELDQKLDGFAIRVPTMNVSLVDLTFTASRNTTVTEVNEILSGASFKPALRKVVQVNKLPLVSVDFNHNPSSSIFDLTQTKVLGNMVKVLAWYDNEWGFSNRMLDTGLAMLQAY